MRIKWGFTQAELVTVAAILGALAAISIPRLVTSPEEANAIVCKSNTVILNKASDAYMAAKNKQATLEELVADRAVFPDGPPECPFGQPYVMGPYGHIIPHKHMGTD